MEDKQTTKTINKVFVGIRSLPNGTVVKVEQSDALNIRLSVIAGEDKQDSFVLTPQAAKALHAMLGGCLKSIP